MNGQADAVSAEAEDPAKEGQARVLITPDAKIARQLVQARGLEAVVTWLRASWHLTLEKAAETDNEQQWRHLRGEAATLKQLLHYVETSVELSEKLQ